jgi:hypothetical protein
MVGMQMLAPHLHRIYNAPAMRAGAMRVGAMRAGAMRAGAMRGGAMRAGLLVWTAAANAARPGGTS